MAQAGFDGIRQHLGLIHSFARGPREVCSEPDLEGVRVVLVVSVVIGIAAPSLGDAFRVRATAKNRWKPTHLFNAHKGDRIAWRNPTGKAHEVKSWNFGKDWSYQADLPAGAVVRKRFRRVGTYYYRCRVNGHSRIVDGTCRGMCGVIHVGK